MATPVSPQKEPYAVDIEAGKNYAWCACGRSQSQPFCDGAHSGTDFRPHVWKAEETKRVYLCGCKHTAGQPFCDGSHSRV